MCDFVHAFNETVLYSVHNLHIAFQMSCGIFSGRFLAERLVFNFQIVQIFCQTKYFARDADNLFIIMKNLNSVCNQHNDLE